MITHALIGLLVVAAFNAALFKFATFINDVSHGKITAIGDMRTDFASTWYWLRVAVYAEAQ